jgi:predicted RND superfamily exporter protein
MRLRAISLFSIAGIARLRVDSNWLNDFSDRVPLKGATARIDEVMGGMSNLVYVFDTGREDGIREPEVLRAIERVQREAERHDLLVRKAYSIVDIVKDLNQSFHDGDSAYYSIPTTARSSRSCCCSTRLPAATRWRSGPRRTSRAPTSSCGFRIAPISLTDELVQQLDRFLANDPIPGVEVQLTGIGALWLELLDYIVRARSKASSTLSR